VPPPATAAALAQLLARAIDAAAEDLDAHAVVALSRELRTTLASLRLAGASPDDDWDAALARVSATVRHTSPG
jgi:hypothetical protein